MRGFLRVWQELDLTDIEKHLIVVGELSSECFACHKIGIDSKSKQCPCCGISFKYTGFRRKDQINYLRKVRQENPAMIFIDFDDFKKALNKRDAKKLLDL
ncbi:MAG: hypothetical protein JSV34_05155 [Candidatus Omnitrophota bacterium]|nr:MAG: hypothetical protein JSV34_05155 [Candidatus Omnitrophota bacterium]